MKKLKAIWHEIIERWFLFTFFAERMERERLQIIAELIKKKDTLWKNIPPGNPRTIKEIIENKEPKKKSVMMEDYDKRSPIIQEALYEALKNIQQKENGNSKKEEDTATEKEAK
jgi:non-homologous end joining protein Ku